MYLMSIVAVLSVSALGFSSAKTPIVIDQEFSSEINCVTALNSITKQLGASDKVHILTQICTPK